MLGWHITIYTQTKGGGSPACFGEPTSSRLAVWQAGLWGLNWIDDLVKDDKALSLGGNGYHCEYTARILHLRETVLNGPPYEHKHWVCGEGDILTDQWLGKTTIDMAALTQCDPDEWVLIRAWDES